MHTCKCGNKIPASEYKAGWRSCEHCEPLMARPEFKIQVTLGYDSLGKARAFVYHGHDKYLSDERMKIPPPNMSFIMDTTDARSLVAALTFAIEQTELNNAKQ